MPQGVAENSHIRLWVYKVFALLYSLMLKPLTLEEVKARILSIEDGRAAAMCAFQFATGCRVGEMKLAKPADIRDRGEYFEVELQNLKNKRTPVKYAVIPKDNEAWLLDIILSYAETRGKHDVLFPVCERHLRRLIKHHFGYASHQLRHARARNLAVEYEFSVPELMKQLGHAKADMSMHYVKLNVKDVARKMVAKSTFAPK